MYLLYFNFLMWPRFKFWHFAERFQQQLVKTRWRFGFQFNPYQSIDQSSFLPVNTGFLITLTNHRSSKSFFGGRVLLSSRSSLMSTIWCSFTLSDSFHISSWARGRGPARSLGSGLQSSPTLPPLHLDSSVSPRISFDDLPTLSDLTFCYFKKIRWL